MQLIRKKKRPPRSDETRTRDRRKAKEQRTHRTLEKPKKKKKRKTKEKEKEETQISDRFCGKFVPSGEFHENSLLFETSVVIANNYISTTLVIY